MQKLNLKIENLVECFDIAQLMDLLQLHIVNFNQKKNYFKFSNTNSGLRNGGKICVVNVMGSQKPTQTFPLNVNWVMMDAFYLCETV